MLEIHNNLINIICYLVMLLKNMFFGLLDLNNYI